MSDVYREERLSDKNFLQMDWTLVYHYKPESKKTIHGVKTRWFSRKEKISGPLVSKEDHADSTLGHEKIHQLISLKKVATRNSVV